MTMSVQREPSWFKYSLFVIKGISWRLGFIFAVSALFAGFWFGATWIWPELASQQTRHYRTLNSSTALSKIAPDLSRLQADRYRQAEAENKARKAEERRQASIESQAKSARKRKEGQLCGELKLFAATSLVLAEQYPNGRDDLEKARLSLVRTGEELAELSDELERLNSCGLGEIRNDDREPECVVISGESFCPDVSYPHRMSKAPIIERLLQIHEKLSEFEAEPKCKTDSNCAVLPTGSQCGPRFYMPYSQLMSKGRTDSLQALTTEYTALDGRLNSLLGRGMLCPAMMVSSPQMRCLVGRCVFEGDRQQAATRIATRDRLLCDSKPMGQPGDYKFRLIIAARKPDSLGNRIAINDDGEVAFEMNDWENGERRKNVMLYTGDGFQAVAEKWTTDWFRNFSGIPEGININTIYVGEDLTRHDDEVINDNGTVAFRAFGKKWSSPAKLVVVKNGEVTVIAAEGVSTPYKSIGRRVAINNLDHVAFSVEKHTGETAVLVYADGETRTVVDDSGAYEVVGGPVGITDAGIVAFGAVTRGSCAKVAIFTGTDPVADKVLGSGDEIDGIKVGPGNIQMNNRGEFAFIADDGVERLYLAQPINRNQDQVVQMDTNNGI
jgi:hypothetical protein